MGDPVCTCRYGCPDVAAMEARHGTPAQFSAAVWRASADGYCTDDEAAKAIRRYERDYMDAYWKQKGATP